MNQIPGSEYSRCISLESRASRKRCGARRRPRHWSPVGAPPGANREQVVHLARVAIASMSRLAISSRHEVVRSRNMWRQISSSPPRSRRGW